MSTAMPRKFSAAVVMAAPVLAAVFWMPSRFTPLGAAELSGSIGGSTSYASCSQSCDKVGGYNAACAGQADNKACTRCTKGTTSTSYLDAAGSAGCTTLSPGYMIPPGGAKSDCGFQENSRCKAEVCPATTNGTDPRFSGGQPSSDAFEYQSPVQLPPGTPFTARVRSDDGLWSAPVRLEMSPEIKQANATKDAPLERTKFTMPLACDPRSKASSPISDLLFRVVARRCVPLRAGASNRHQSQSAADGLVKARATTPGAGTGVCGRKSSARRPQD